jgi:bacterioferritin (cytochrome b1)
LIFEPMIAAGEETIDWLETQLALIEQLGEAAYLAEQLA